MYLFKDINKLNSVLESEDENQTQFQYSAPSTADTVINRSSQNSIVNDVEISLHSQNETLASPPSSKQQQNISDELSSTTDVENCREKI